ncbi:MAG: HAD family phosphatase [Nocardioidaceae bacterium]
MTIKAVVFDVGGVLQTVEEASIWLDRWRDRLGLDPDEFATAIARVDRDDVIGVGRLSEPEFRQQYVEILGLSEVEGDAFMAEMWDWYCGELDIALVEFVRGLRPRYQTAILSNSADGARREEEARYRFSDLFDTIIYSHEVGLAKPDPRIYELTCKRLRVSPHEVVLLDDTPAIVDSAREFGIHAVLHESTPASIASINGLLAETV